MIKFIVKYILSPLIALILFAVLSQLLTNDWLKLFTLIPITVWIIVVLLILICFLLIKLNKLRKKTQEKIEPFKAFNAYWFWIGKTGRVDGPFCIKCYDDENKKIRLNNLHTERDDYECPKCKNIYTFVRLPAPLFKPSKPK